MMRKTSSFNVKASNNIGRFPKFHRACEAIGMMQFSHASITGPEFEGYQDEGIVMTVHGNPLRRGGEVLIITFL